MAVFIWWHEFATCIMFYQTVIVKNLSIFISLICCNINSALQTNILPFWSNIVNNNVVFQLMLVHGNINNRCRLQFMYNSSTNIISIGNLLSNLAIMLKRIRRNTNSTRIVNSSNLFLEIKLRKCFCFQLFLAFLHVDPINQLLTSLCVAPSSQHSPLG